MTDEEKFQHWLKIAKYDLKTASTLYAGKNWQYTIFMCQQAIEKLVKALYGSYIDFNTIPHIHDIAVIFQKFENGIPKTIPVSYRRLFAELTVYYLNNRYPDYKDNLIKIKSKRKATAILKKSQECFSWLLTLKP